jgi:uncharacterized damage-inducible protein DinB
MTEFTSRPETGVIGPFDLEPDPPYAVGERDTLVTFLDYYRSVLLRKAAGLTAEQLSAALPPGTLTLGGLLKHMALVEDNWFSHNWQGVQHGEPWTSVDWDADPDWDFHSAKDDQPGELLALYTDAVDRSRAAIADSHDLSATVESRGRVISLRWILVHMIEEYARHCGHADLIREAIDGQTGD